MKYAAKIPFRPDLKYMGRANIAVGKHAKSSEEANPILVRYYIPKKQVEMIKEALPQELRNTPMGVCRTTIDIAAFENDLRPHVHTDEKCVLNYYMKTSGEDTLFFEGEVVADDEASIDNGNMYFMVKPELLNEVERFTAQPGDAWLMSTRQPHEVICPEGQKQVRDILQIYFFDLTFDEVYKIFRGAEC